METPPPPPAPPSPAPALGALALAVAMLGAQSLAMRSVGGALPVRLLLAYLVASAAILVATTGAWVTPWRSGSRALALALGGVLLGFVGVFAGRHAAGHPAVATLAGLASSAAVLSVGTALGASVGLRIAHPGHLLAVALASSGADLWSVLSPQGVSRAVVDAAASVQRVVAVSAQVDPALGPDAMIGLGDVIFAALYWGAAQAHGLSRWRTRLALLLGLLASGAVALLVGAPLPALPLMGLAVVALVPESRRVARRDRNATWMAGALLLAAIAVLALGRLRRH